jgi:RNA recognition motif-containing protein
MSLSFDEYLNNLPDAPWLVSEANSIPNPVTTDQHQLDLDIQDTPLPIEPTSPEPVSKYLLLSNLKPTTTKKTIEVLFSKYGVIRKITINKNTSGAADSTAVIEFA